jgi:S-DNA-T family DNA segregation ATPase FtsK/SpoIIIE
MTGSEKAMWGAESGFKAEGMGLLYLALGILLGMSIASYHPGDPSFNNPDAFVPVQNLAGIVGSYLADILLQSLGATSYLVPPCFFFACYCSFRKLRWQPGLLGSIGLGVFAISLSALLSLAIRSPGSIMAGGFLGGITAAILEAYFNIAGAAIIISLLLVLALIALFGTSPWPLMSSPLQWQKIGWPKRQPKIAVRIDPPEPTDLVFQEPPAEPHTLFREIRAPSDEQDYVLPDLELLDTPSAKKVYFDRELLEAHSRILQHKLADFGVTGEVTAVRPGPVITMYEFKPAPGVKVRHIVPLADDLSMALKALSVRILAPIPGESVVGIEVPNPERSKVSLREILEMDLYRRSDSLLTLALGLEIFGDPLVADLAKMPHLLVAGATGTGKSVSIHAMILSILFRVRPEEVRFIMIDPKMLELSVYEEIPHLLVPVVTDPKKAAAALNWAVEEMERRYCWMRDLGVRNVDGYNRSRKGTEKSLLGLEEEEPPPTHLSKIVIIIDELADLMLSVRRDIEESITRLAQKARAAGIHLILATQRPSVDVITGLIKANFPARISFQVASRVDSRTILDSMGAERLLGDGDMLFLPAGTSKLVRVHGPYVSEGEIHRVVEHLRAQGKPALRKEILDGKPHGPHQVSMEENDEMYDLAVRLVTETRLASISMLQRRLKLGFNRAARLIEQMEREGVVGPSEGGKPREVLAQKIE